MKTAILRLGCAALLALTLAVSYLPVAFSLMEQAPGEKGEAIREHLKGVYDLERLLARVGPPRRQGGE